MFNLKKKKRYETHKIYWNCIIFVSKCVSSCKKEKIDETSFVNPFDKYGNKIEKYYLDLKQILQDSTSRDSSIYKKRIMEIMKNFDDTYPSIDTSNYSEYESNYISLLISQYIDNKDIMEVAKRVEILVNEDQLLSEKQKNRLFSLISQYKYHKYFSNKILNCDATKAPSWEDRLNNCFEKRLSDIFADDGNPIPEIEFISELPGSFGWLVADCTWEATFG